MFYCDASILGLGVVFMQKGRVITYASCNDPKISLLTMLVFRYIGLSSIYVSCWIICLLYNSINKKRLITI